jgi:hypothetical protein
VEQQPLVTPCVYDIGCKEHRYSQMTDSKACGNLDSELSRCHMVLEHLVVGFK